MGPETYLIREEERKLSKLGVLFVSSHKPVVLFIDGAKTHLTLHLSNFCAENGIELYCLYPNATHIIQPATSVYSIKLGWRQAVHKWQGDNPNKCLTKVNFAPLLANVFPSDTIMGEFT